MAPNKPAAPTSPQTSHSVIHSRVQKRVQDRAQKCKHKHLSLSYHDNRLLNVGLGLAANTEKNKTQCPLLRLPGEIRNSIWELALGGNTFKIASRTEDFDLTTKVTNYPDRFGALLQTCRQIYAEASLVPYHSNVFACLDIHAFRWLRKLPDHGRDHIEDLELYTYDLIHIPKLNATFLPGGSLYRRGLFSRNLLQGLKRVVVYRMYGLTSRVEDLPADIHAVEHKRFHRLMKNRRQAVDVKFKDTACWPSLRDWRAGYETDDFAPIAHTHFSWEGF